MRQSLLVAGLTAVGAGVASGQATDCNSLYAAIQAGDSRSASPSSWDRAAQQQRREIARTQRFADQLRCGQGRGLFGGGDPPQCGPILDRLQRMQENLAAIEARDDQSPQSDPGRQAALVARYNAQCAGGVTANPADVAARGDRGLLPEEGRSPADMLDPDDLSSVPLNGDIMDGSSEPRQNLGQAICVRTCDGGYFPLGSRATQDQLGGLEQLCQASCPNTEAKLYTMGKNGDLTSATATDGESYTALPAAFAFEKTFSPTCTCKPPNRSWVEALADAEKLIGSGDRHDVTVTTSLSDQMAKAGAVGPVPGKKPLRATIAARAVAPAPDLSAAHDAQKGQQAPTASTDTTGIGGPVSAERFVREGEGPTVAVAGPDGIRKRIRLIVP